MTVFLAAAAVASGQAYRFGKVWDGTRAWTNAVVVVDGDRITHVGPWTGPAADLTRYTALPGLIDVHTHMTYTAEVNRVSAAARAAATVFLAQDNARRTLETGVT